MAFARLWDLMQTKGLALQDVVTELHKFVSLLESKDPLAKAYTPTPRRMHPVYPVPCHRRAHPPTNPPTHPHPCSRRRGLWRPWPTSSTGSR